MRGFLIRILISAAGLWIASALIPGLEIRGTGTLVVAALLLGIVNALVRPFVVLITLPLTILTLGLFLWVVNAAMLGLVAALLDGFAIRGFLPALLGSFVVSVTGWLASQYVGSRGRTELLIVRRGP